MNARLNDYNGKGNANMYIESDERCINMPESYVLANKPHSGKTSKIKDFISGNPNIGKGSSGFASVITLASVIAVAGAIVAFITLKY